MAEGEARRSTVRWAAALLAGLAAAFTALTYLSYSAAFTSTARVTVTAPRAGLGMYPDAKVKYRGIQVGKVSDISYQADQAQLTLAINSDQLHYIPANATVRLAANTTFGAKAVEFLPPAAPSATPLRPGTHVQASAVQLEVNTLFQSVIFLLQQVDPLDLNGTLSAFAEGLRGHGDDLGGLLAGVTTLATQVNPKLPTLQQDFRQAATVANTYAAAAPNLTTAINNLSAVSTTVTDQQQNLNRTLLAAIGLANSAYDTLAPAEQDFIAAVNRLRAPVSVAAEYSPEFGCLVQGVVRGLKEYAPLIGVRKAGLFTSSNFILGSPAYTYPNSLPVVNASGGPNCRGLPDIPTKQSGGSFYRAPFLVTDNAYIPYQPFTELHVDAPSTLQFLFNGTFAERDDF